jgi:inorganic pyrophosphatase
MGLDRVPSGKSLPNDFNVIIEIPMHADPVKYEVDKDSGAVFVDRFMSTAMHYPCNYGYIPHTIAGDGDPVDVLVVTQFALPPGSSCAAVRSACWRWKTRPGRMASCWLFRWIA